MVGLAGDRGIEGEAVARGGERLGTAAAVGCFGAEGAQRQRATNDILIAVVDGLKGFPEAITAVYPDTVVQTCIVHLIRNSIELGSWKERRHLAQALKTVYQADTAEGAEQR